MYCLQAALSLMSGKEITSILEWKELGDRDAFLLVLPGLLLGATLILLTRFVRHYAVLPCFLLAVRGSLPGTGTSQSHAILCRCKCGCNVAAIPPMGPVHGSPAWFSHLPCSLAHCLHSLPRFGSPPSQNKNKNKPLRGLLIDALAMQIPAVFHLTLLALGMTVAESATCLGHGWVDAGESNAEFWLVWQHFRFDLVQWHVLPQQVRQASQVVPYLRSSC